MWTEQLEGRDHSEHRYKSQGYSEKVSSRLLTAERWSPPGRGADGVHIKNAGSGLRTPRATVESHTHKDIQCRYIHIENDGGAPGPYWDSLLFRLMVESHEDGGRPAAAGLRRPPASWIDVFATGAAPLAGEQLEGVQHTHTPASEHKGTAAASLTGRSGQQHKVKHE